MKGTTGRLKVIKNTTADTVANIEIQSMKEIEIK